MSAHDVLFGCSIAPVAERYDEIVRFVRLADDLELDLVGIQDHPYQRRFLDTWTLITALATRTRRIRFFPDVANLPLRPPAMMAKAASTIDRITGGRFELGLGAGGFWDAIEAMGGPRRSPVEAIEALEEAIAVIRLMWSDERGVRFEGKHYRLSGVKPGPPPAHPIQIWLGAYRPRMLRLVGRAADGWIPSYGPGMPVERLASAIATIEEAAREAGRDPKAVRRLYNVGAVFRGDGAGPLSAPLERWPDELARLVEMGMDGFIFWPGDAPDAEDLLRRFAEEVVPGVRAKLGDPYARGE